MKAAVLGSPVGHSLSPALHRAAYTELGLDGWSYQAIECDEARLPALIGSLGAGWAGLSLTMPLKRVVIPLLDWVSPLAAEVGAVNTVACGRDGVLRGYNTDVGGMVDALRAAAPPPSADARGRGDNDQRIPAGALIVGAGATACSTLAALRDIGLRKVTVAVRATKRAGDLLAVADRLGIAVRLTGVDELGRQGADASGLIVSTVPSGAADELAGRLVALAPAAVLDVVYSPWPTALAVAARAAGADVIGGFDLLLYQAARQVALMTGLEPPVQAMRSAGLAALGRPDR